MTQGSTLNVLSCSMYITYFSFVACSAFQVVTDFLSSMPVYMLSFYFLLSCHAFTSYSQISTRICFVTSYISPKKIHSSRRIRSLLRHTLGIQYPYDKHTFGNLMSILDMVSWYWGGRKFVFLLVASELFVFNFVFIQVHWVLGSHIDRVKGRCEISRSPSFQAWDSFVYYVSTLCTFYIHSLSSISTLSWRSDAKVQFHPSGRTRRELLVQHFPIDDVHSACFCSQHPDSLRCVLDEWPTSSRTKSSSGAQKVPFDWRPSFNAQHTRMGDVCEVETRIPSVMVMGRDSDPPLCIQLMFCADSNIIHVNSLGTSMIILNSYEVATDLLDQRSSTYSSR